MHPLLFIVLLLLTFGTSVLLAKCLLRPARPAVAGIGLLVFWLCALIVPLQWMALLELAGLTSGLRPGHLFLWNGLAFAGAFALWRHRMRRRGRDQRVETGTERRPPMSWHLAIGLLIVLCVYAILFARMAFSFPDAYDAVAYHYPVALRWLQEGTLRITSASNWRASLPGNVELLDLLVLSTGRDRLLGVVQWPGLLILLLACLHLGRRLSESRVSGWPVVTTALMIPIVANQSTAGYVDLFCTALLFGGLTLVLEYCDQVKNANGTAEGMRGLLVAAGLGCGLAVGAKPVYWFYACLLFLATVFMLSRLGSNPIRRVWRQVALFVAAGALPCMFWFARATICTGNPVYPFAIEIGSLSLAGVHTSDITRPDYYLAYVRHWAEWFVYPWTEWRAFPGVLGVNYTTGDGLGGAFATFVMPGVVFAGWLARSRRPSLRVWLLALAVLGVCWWFLLQKVGRFGLPLFVLAVVVSAPFFETLELRATRLYRSLYVLVFAVTACILVFEPLVTITQTVRRHTWSRAAYYGYPAVIDSLRPGSTILNLSEETLNFGLAGSGLANHVIPSWESPPHLTAEFLQSRQIDYVVERLVGDDTRGMVVDKQAPGEGLESYFRSSGMEGERAVSWRVWSASRLRKNPLPRLSGSSMP